jgi:aspartyl-tRNA synthetase
MKNRILIGELNNYIDQTVTIGAWVDTRRDQGKMIFFEFRDRTGKVQGVVLPKKAGAEVLPLGEDLGGGGDAMEIAKTLRSEWVVAVTGRVNKRPERNVQADKQNGAIELEVLGIEVLNEAETPIFDISTDTRIVNEEVRLKHKYLDMRSDRVQKNIRMRAKTAKFIRDFLETEGFIEVETPLLTKSTPEGARDFIVPARLYPGNFYALPQSPQQYKQLLMTGGIERYFQIAKCLRDEDSRGDRQPEFTQIDMEMSFVEQSDVMDVNERLLIKTVQDLYPEKKIQQIPFPRLTYKEAMEKYGNDRPDLREDKNDSNLLAFCWIVDFPFFEATDTSDNPDTHGEWTFTHNPFSAPKPEHMEWLMNKENIGNILTTQYDIALNGYEIGGGSIRNHKPQALRKVFEIMGHEPVDIESNFGHMLQAFSLGTPPHGGIAWGFDRLMMLLQNEPNIREVIPFPKTGEGKDPMMESPAPVSDKQLAELNIITTKK